MRKAWAIVGLCVVLMAGCAGPSRQARLPAPFKVVLSGTLVFSEPVALSDDAVAKVWLQDMSDPRSPVPVILDEQVIQPPGRSPVPFRVRYDPKAIHADRQYTILVKIYDHDRVRLLNRRRFPVITSGCTQDCEIVLERMN